MGRAMTAVERIGRYSFRRLAQAIPIVLGIVVLNFLLLQLAPGDAADVLAGEAGSATPEFMAQLRQRFGLDQPLYVQLALYMKNILSLDLGYSFRHNMSVVSLILERLWPTLLGSTPSRWPGLARARPATHLRLRPSAADAAW